ncbi:MAG: hypothetical protein U9O95_01855 [Candidatus Marinimicrobia bacterium]|nr:hypothetical protein [Candidatus Neomarinimicrobiota bacterium]
MSKLPCLRNGDYYFSFGTGMPVPYMVVNYCCLLLINNSSSTIWDFSPDLHRDRINPKGLH